MDMVPPCIAILYSVSMSYLPSIKLVGCPPASAIDPLEVAAPPSLFASIKYLLNEFIREILLDTRSLPHLLICSTDLIAFLQDSAEKCQYRQRHKSVNLLLGLFILLRTRVDESNLRSPLVRQDRQSCLVVVQRSINTGLCILIMSE